MKMLTIEVVETFSESTYWITGRCCREDIRIGDILFHNTQPDLKVVVVAIEVYNKERNVLCHGYVGCVKVELINGNSFVNNGLLVDRDDKKIS